jgi:hypothetical protein
MDNFNNNGLAAGADPKAAVMNQVRQEAAMSNARQLIEVDTFSLLIAKVSNTFVESQ